MIIQSSLPCRTRRHCSFWQLRGVASSRCWSARQRHSGCFALLFRQRYSTPSILVMLLVKRNWRMMYGRA